MGEELPPLSFILKRSDTVLVNPSGPRDAKMAIVGEAPGRDEEREGEPFVGHSGRLLTQLLRLSKMPRTDCYITNVSKERPKGNNFRRKYYDSGQPTPELLSLREGLLEELREVNPNVTLALGNEAMEALTGVRGISSWRGSILEAHNGLKVIPTYHPAGTLRMWDYFPYMLFDITKAVKDSEFPELRIPNPELLTDITFEEAIHYLSLLKEETKVAFDIETARKWITMISFCPNSEWSICIPFLKTRGGKVLPESYWNPVEERIIWEKIADILADPQIGMIAQNANYDIAYMHKYGCPTENLYMDTMNAHHCVYPETRKGLGVLQSIYTRVPFHKDSSKEDIQRYNALDSYSTRLCCDAIDEELRDFGTFEFYHEFIKKAVMEYRESSDIGMKIDPIRQKELMDLYEKKELELEDEIDKHCPWDLDSQEGSKLNPRSPQQLMEYFYEKRGYYKYKKNGKPTTNEDALQRLARKYPNDPIPELVLEARKVRKTLGTYVKVRTDPDHRVRTTIKVSGSKTGRVASSESINETGTNLQNIQKGEVRSMYVPSHSDWIFTEADYSGADALVLAYVCGDPGMIALFESDADYHATNTYLFFECPVPNPSFIRKEDVPEDLRFQSKAISHGSNYGRGYKAIALELRKSETEIMEKQKIYFNRYPGIKQYHREIQRILKTTATIETSMGRKRTFFHAFRPGSLSHTCLNEAYSHIPQSTVADVTHRGFIKTKEMFQKQGSNFPGRVLLNIHDSVLVEHHKNIRDEVIDIMNESMIVPLRAKGRDFIIPVEFASGERWDEL